MDFPNSYLGRILLEFFRLAEWRDGIFLGGLFLDLQEKGVMLLTLATLHHSRMTVISLTESSPLIIRASIVRNVAVATFYGCIF